MHKEKPPVEVKNNAPTISMAISGRDSETFWQHAKSKDSHSKAQKENVLTISVLTLDQFNLIAEKAHETCFEETRPKEMNTFDFALLATDKDDNAIAYATCIEIDSESVYMQHGGAFPNAQKSMRAVNAYHRFIAYLRTKFKRASTRIRNFNIPMLKMAFSAGFIINGCDCHGEEIYLHLINNFEGV